MAGAPGKLLRFSSLTRTCAALAEYTMLQPFVVPSKPTPPFPRSVTGRMLRSLAARDVPRGDLRGLEQHAAELGHDPATLPPSAPLKYASGDESEDDK